TGPNAIKSFYHASKERTHDVRHARLNTQRKILEAMWQIWLRHRPFDPNKFCAQTANASTKEVKATPPQSRLALTERAYVRDAAARHAPDGENVRSLGAGGNYTFSLIKSLDRWVSSIAFKLRRRPRQLSNRERCALNSAGQTD